MSDALARYIKDTSSSNQGADESRYRDLVKSGQEALESKLKLEYLKSIHSLQRKIDKLGVRLNIIEQGYISEEKAGEIALNKIGFVIAAIAGVAAFVGFIVAIT